MLPLNQIILGDCIEVMKTLPERSIDLVITSPPYNLRNSSGNGMKSPGRKWKNPQLQFGYETHDDNMPHDEYVAWQRDCLTEMMRLIPETGAIFYNHKWRVQKGLIQDRADIVDGFPVRQIIIWQRKGGMNFNPQFFLPTYEVIYLIAKPKFRLADKANAQGDVWQVTQEFKSSHPAPFPVELPEKIIRSTNSQIILDPFMGSGSTAIAALKCNRGYIGIEKSPQYQDMALKRIKELQEV